MKKTFTLVLLLLCASAVFSQATETATATPASDPFSPKADVEASVKKVPCKPEDRREGVKQLFRDAGAKDDQITLETFDKEKAANVIVKLPGKTAETIVIGAHYDRTGLGCGVTDNWTGIAIIAHIYRTLRPMEMQKSYVFVGFDREEEGLRGSRDMVKKMPETDRANVCSMLNFDSFGQGYPIALENASSSKMVEYVKDFAKESKVNFTAVKIEGASSDSAAFVEKKIPAITLSGLSGNWQQILHTPERPDRKGQHEQRVSELSLRRGARLQAGPSPLQHVPVKFK